MQQVPNPKVFAGTVSAEQVQQFEKAAATYRETIKKNPRDAQALYILSLIECQLGKVGDAIPLIEKALVVQPRSPDIQCHYGLMLMELGQADKAAVAFRKSIVLNNKNPETHYHYGNALIKQNKVDEAIAEFEAAIALNPFYVEALNNLGNVLKDRNQLQEAMGYYRRALAVNPNYALAVNNMGLALMLSGELHPALVFFNRALEINPNYPEALNNKGVAIRLQGDFIGSISWFERALALRSEYPEVLNNLGNAFKDAGELEKSINFYARALALKESSDYLHNQAMALMAAARFDEGLRAYEARWKTPQLAHTYRAFQKPQWYGEDGQGRTLLIHAEQGFGDTLQFCRFARLAAARGFRVVMEVQPALLRLLQTLQGVDQIVAQGESLPAFDLHCPMLSLPLAFQLQLETIPSENPYLFADPADIARFRQTIPVSAKKKIGLVWSGNPRKQALELAATDRRRSMAVENYAPLFDVSDVDFYSLQKDGHKAPPDFPLIDLMDDCRDFADTAALIMNLDLVISVDTAVAHLAAALGKPTWVMNRFDSCWRWLKDRQDSPWYPTLRLFTQTRPGDWTDVIARVKEELMAIQDMP